MNRLLVNALYMGVAAACATGLGACSHNASAEADAPGGSAAAAAPAAQNTGPQYAQVVNVTPIQKTTTTPKQVCNNVVVDHTEPPKDEHHIAGTAIGAVVGGLLGHMVGGGRGRTLATVAGAVGGGYAGNRIEAAHQHGQVVSTVERQCNTVNNTTTRTVGYNVTYVYNGVTRTTRMDHDPGSRVQVQQGVIAVSSAQ